MSETLVSAIIGAAATLLAVPLTVIVTRIADRRALIAIDRGRAGVGGVWRGTLAQDDAAEILVEEVEMTLSVRRKRVTGRGYFRAKQKHSTETATVNLTFEGGFLYERFVKLEYRNADVYTVQFGTAILDLSNDSQTLTGAYVGFGSMTGSVVKGRLRFTKIKAA